jgi:hypothetical protein
MAALTEDQQMAAAIAASLTLNNPDSVPAASTTSTMTTGEVGEAKQEEPPLPQKKKRGKLKILRFNHSNGLHRMAKVEFNTTTLKNVKIRLVEDMQLRIDPSTIIIKLDKTSTVEWDTQWDSQTITELGITKNGAKLWLEFPEPKSKPLWSGLGRSFMGPGMSTIGPERLANAQVIGIYFSAQ